MHNRTRQRGHQWGLHSCQEGLLSVIKHKEATRVTHQNIKQRVMLKGAAGESYIPAKKGYLMGWNTKKPRDNYLSVRGMHRYIRQRSSCWGLHDKGFDHFSWILGRFPTRQESQPDQRGRQVIVRRELRQISQIPAMGAVRSERPPGHR